MCVVYDMWGYVWCVSVYVWCVWVCIYVYMCMCVVKQIENIIGAKKIIEIVNTKPEEMYKALNMSKSEFENFCNTIVTGKQIGRAHV